MNTHPDDPGRTRPRRRRWLGTGILWVMATAALAQTNYTLGEFPGYPRLHTASAYPLLTADQQTWAATNNILDVCSGALEPGLTGGQIVYPRSPTAPGKRVFQLEACLYGYTFERSRPNYYLGETLAPPANVDWAATYGQYLQDCQTSSNLAWQIFFDRTAPAIYLAAGGDLTITWVLGGGEQQVQSYKVAPVARVRPFRLFWTSYPYNANPVDLSGKYVKLLGPPSLLQIQQGVVTNFSPQTGVTVTTGIVSGVYLDTGQSQHLSLHAAGELRGQFLLAYYDSGTYDRLLDVVVVEVCAPVVKEQSVSVGDQLFPSGDGYDSAGLRVYQLNAAEPADGRGAYLYQHRGQYTYSPKNEGVFSVRPTTPTTLALAEVYWAETDSQNVSWPFECDHYLSTWSPDTPRFVRGDRAAQGGTPIYLPDVYTVDLMTYQEPDHARLDAANQKVYSSQEGYALLKLQADDNIWFQPVHSVMNTSHPRTTNRVAVGTELRPPAAIRPLITEDIPACLYEEGSSRNYNPNIYIPPTVNPDPEATVSALYFVNTNRNPNTPVLEAWWVLSVQQEGMPEPLNIPSQPAWYQAQWPGDFEAPQIVLASQLGGLGRSFLWNELTSQVDVVTNQVIVADETPLIYTQNDVSGVGYNPNEEHAIIRSGGGGYVPWAIRCDLNTPDSSRPAVLTQYVQDGRYKMCLHHVVLTNALYPRMSGNMIAGTVLPGPHPLDFLANPWLKQTYCVYGGAPSPEFRDRKGVFWARSDGEINIHMFYPMQSGFWLPSLSSAAQPAVDTPIPWLALVENPSANVLTGEPLSWQWLISWPAAVPEMRIGQTLTKAQAGLPEVWAAKSMGVVYPHPFEREQTILLHDPTLVQTAGFNAGVKPVTDFGFTLGDHGNAMIRQGKYYFRDLPPTISDRFYYNPNAALSRCLCLRGKLEENAAGADILYVNVLNPAERDALRNIVPPGAANKTIWDRAIDQLATNAIEPTTTYYDFTGEEHMDYAPADHYALTAIGRGDYVVLIENDSTNELTGVQPGDVISMHVLKVKPELHAGRVVTRQDPNNLLSQQLDVLYTEMLAGQPNDFIFEWKKAPPDASGTIPTDFENAYVAYGPPQAGRTRFTLGAQGSTLADLVNTYYAMRYKPQPGTPAHDAVGDTWSDWCGPALAEGWVQRVLNAITPFAQRMRDLYENEAETAVSMLEQIGGPYEGDVALNQDNLTQVGLIQLYQTVLNKAESLSIAQGINSGEANKQLLLAVERLADLYMLLGNEAYGDAVNPTIGMASHFTQNGVDYGMLASALHSFANQVPSLLDEELALLRGRSLANAPGNRIGPFFNRLLWNFTKGITAGEVAYTVNYGITDKTGDGIIDENDAAIMYPQGHGDAWGHYLSALKGYYRLLRNPYFSWGEVSMGEMNLADLPVNVDYGDESRFAQVAAALAKTGNDILDRTARKAWAEGGTGGAGYLDSNTNRAFGYGEWGTRAGLGAFYNWAVANSLLPPPPAAPPNMEGGLNDAGLLRIDRASVHELSALSAAHAVLQQKVDRLDQGRNPLGFSERAIPFDISAQGLADGTTSHFEQIYERAVTALKNAGRILGRAQTYGHALRQLQDVEEDYTAALDNQERGYNDQLIAIFGYPFEGDIGVSGTYVQGYDGPDLFHFMWLDLAPFGLTNAQQEVAVTNTLYFAVNGPYTNSILESSAVHSITTTQTVYQLSYQQTANGIVVKPNSVTGTRRAAGRIQQAHVNLIQAQLAVARKRHDLERTAADVQDAVSAFAARLPDREYAHTMERLYTLRRLEAARYSFSVIGTIAETGVDLMDGLGSVFDAGLFAAYKSLCVGLEAAFVGFKYGAELIANTLEFKKTLIGMTAEMEAAEDAFGESVNQMCTAAIQAIDRHAQAVFDLNEAWAAMLEANENVETIVAEGQRLLEAREQTRLQAVSQLTQARYGDMFFRLIQNESLTRYSTAFDLAQQYTWLAARAYDYETGRLTADTEAGEDFLRRIIAARTIGPQNADGRPELGGEGLATGDPGLADILARMEANWQVLKPRLGINNPQPYTTWFSLRHGLYRILPGAAGDAAWSTELAKHWVANILDMPEFKRYCLAFNPAQAREPGLVIPFSTTIEAGKNLFGRGLAGGDSAYDSTYFATKIAAAGVRFVDYNACVAGSAIPPQLSQTPVVYLVPLGTDRMRDPGHLATVLDYPILDQVMQEPFLIGSQSLATADWTTIYNNLVGATNGAITIRRYPSFRASIAESEGPDIREASKRLVGRSVWNTQWALIIPAAALGADREAALTTFIRGYDANRDGQLDQLPVRDIQIGLRTYSNSGN